MEVKANLNCPQPSRVSSTEEVKINKKSNLPVDVHNKLVNLFGVFKIFIPEDAQNDFFSQEFSALLDSLPKLLKHLEDQFLKYPKWAKSLANKYPELFEQSNFSAVPYFKEIVYVKKNHSDYCFSIYPTFSFEDGQKLDLRNIDLSNYNLIKINFSNCDLSGTNLSGANLSNANLFGANLSGANLSGANLSGTDLREANLSGTDLREATLDDTYLSANTIILGTLFRKATTNKVEIQDIIDYQEDVLKKYLCLLLGQGQFFIPKDICNIITKNIFVANFNEKTGLPIIIHNQCSNMFGILKKNVPENLLNDFLNGNRTLEDCCPIKPMVLHFTSIYPDLFEEFPDSQGRFFKRSIFDSLCVKNQKILDMFVLKEGRKPSLTCKDLSNYNLAGINFSNCNLSKINFSKANLSGANFSGSDLYIVHFFGANLSGANFSGATFSEVDLSEVDLSEANLSEADLSGVNFS